MPAKTLMILGTSSSAGKSLLVTALCHSFARRGLRVAPFKAQNMSNNAAVCPDGSEIGRAQALQAQAAGIPLSADLNPILIKPESDASSQVIVMGRPFRRLEAAAYYDHKDYLWTEATAALDRLRAQYDLVILEGAGSPVELNLKSWDIVNFAMADYADAQVLLVGDIDRGGIFAQMLGTLWLLEPRERRRVRGLIVNKFRGDPHLFEAGVRMLEEKGGIQVLGVVPYLQNLGLPEEDAVALDARKAFASTSAQIDIAVIHFPLIANFDDFDPFQNDPGAGVRYVTSAEGLGRPDAVCLPGTKSTISDLDWLRCRGLDTAILAHAHRGGAVVGICGGYQMLGETIIDASRVESDRTHVRGLGLLPVHTRFENDKATYPAQGFTIGGPDWLDSTMGISLTGYEIHMGRTQTPSPWLEIHRTVDEGIFPAQITMDGAASPDGRVWGCYLHGLFVSTPFRRAWLHSLGWSNESGVEGIIPDVDLEPQRFNAELARLTDVVEAALNMKLLEEILWGS